MTTPIAFTDAETLGLDPAKHAMWEVAVIHREGGTDTEYLWQISPDKWELEKADPEALRINRFHERMILPEGYQAGEMLHACGLPHPVTRNDVRAALRELLPGAVLVGSNPSFDASFLREFLDDAPWHYRTVDIATLAAGLLAGRTTAPALSLPFSSRELSRAVGVEPPGDGVAHTALGDARWARDVFDAVTGGAR